MDVVGWVILREGSDYQLRGNIIALLLSVLNQMKRGPIFGKIWAKHFWYKVSNYLKGISIKSALLVTMTVNIQD